MESVKPFTGVESICKDIYLSGRSNYLYIHRGLSAIDYLKVHNLYEYFSDFITRENNFKRKPDPEALLYLIDKHDSKFADYAIFDFNQLYMIIGLHL